MHFPHNCFSYKENVPTIIPKSENIPLIALGKSNTGTDLDFLHVNLLYCRGTYVQLHIFDDNCKLLNMHYTLHACCLHNYTSMYTRRKKVSKMLPVGM